MLAIIYMEYIFINVGLMMIENSYGTGSYPPSLSGWQRQILLIPNNPPLNKPYFIIACLVYSEQVG